MTCFISPPPSSRYAYMQGRATTKRDERKLRPAAYDHLANKTAMEQRKRYKIRFYRASIGADPYKASCSEKLLMTKMDNGMTKPIEVGDKSLQVRGVVESKDKKVVRGYVVRFRDEAPLTGARDVPDESPVALEPGREFIERNHFVIFRERPGLEVIAYQPSLEGAHISNLGRYLTLLYGAEEAVHFDEILNIDAYKALAAGGVIRAIEFRIAKPRNKKFAPNPDDIWTQEGMDFMKATGATTFAAKIATRAHNKGLVGQTRDAIKRLLESSQTKTLKVTVSDRDSPIDLLADRIYQDISVEAQNGVVESSAVFNAIETAKMKAQHQIDEYFGQGDEVLH